MFPFLFNTSLVLCLLFIVASLHFQLWSWEHTIYSIVSLPCLFYFSDLRYICISFPYTSYHRLCKRLCQIRARHQRSELELSSTAAWLSPAQYRAIRRVWEGISRPFSPHHQHQVKKQLPVASTAGLFGCYWASEHARLLLHGVFWGAASGESQQLSQAHTGLPPWDQQSQPKRERRYRQRLDPGRGHGGAGNTLGAG